MTRVLITSGKEIPRMFGELRAARKKGLVRIREPANPREIFNKSWGTLEAIPGLDIVVLSKADSDGYPCKREVFDATYEEAEPGSGQFRKTALSRLVQVPKGFTVEVKTTEGMLTAEHPDYVVIGVNNEVYVNAYGRVDRLRGPCFSSFSATLM